MASNPDMPLQWLWLEWLWIFVGLGPEAAHFGAIQSLRA
jgi:hypothetical protein